MKSPTVAPLIATSLVRLHTFEIEEVRSLNEPGEAGLWKKLFLFVNSAKGIMFHGSMLCKGRHCKTHYYYFSDSSGVAVLENELNLVESEINWLRECLAREQVSIGNGSEEEEGGDGILFGCEIVLCHNDLLCGNILLCPSEVPGSVEKAVLIDYEYSMYNYRAFDIANHFCGITFRTYIPIPSRCRFIIFIQYVCMYCMNVCMERYSNILLKIHLVECSRFILSPYIHLRICFYCRMLWI